MAHTREPRDARDARTQARAAHTRRTHEPRARRTSGHLHGARAGTCTAHGRAETCPRGQARTHATRDAHPQAHRERTHTRTGRRTRDAHMRAPARRTHGHPQAHAGTPAGAPVARAHVHPQAHPQAPARRTCGAGKNISPRTYRRAKEHRAGAHAGTCRHTRRHATRRHTGTRGCTRRHTCGHARAHERARLGTARALARACARARRGHPRGGRGTPYSIDPPSDSRSKCFGCTEGTPVASRLRGVQ